MVQEKNRIFKKDIAIGAETSRVWNALTLPGLMKQWMSDTEIEIDTNWEPGSAFFVRGELHGQAFENKGLVLAFDCERCVSYSHLSSISELPDVVENYSVLEFKLTASNDQTLLSLTITGFPTETIFKHLEFYWNVTLLLLKQCIEDAV